MHDATNVDEPTDETIESPGPLRVVDRRTAARAMRVVARARTQFEEEEQTAADQLAVVDEERAERCRDLDGEEERIRQWLAARRVDLERVESHFVRQLTAWHESVLDADDRPWAKKRDKTVSLPSGDLRAKRPADEWIYDDETAFVAWAMERHAGLVRHRVEFSPIRADVKKAGFWIDQDTGNVYVAPPVEVAPAVVDETTGEVTTPAEVAMAEQVPGVSVAGAAVEFSVVTR